MKNQNKPQPQNIEELREYVAKLEHDVAINNQLIDAQKKRISELENEVKQREAKPYTLLKNTRRTPDGKKFDNLYLQVGEGGKFAPLAIQLVKFNPKQKNLLLALAKPCEIRRVTLVSDLDKRGASASVIDDGLEDGAFQNGLKKGAEPQPNTLDVRPDDLPF